MILGVPSVRVRIVINLDVQGSPALQRVSTATIAAAPRVDSLALLAPGTSATIFRMRLPEEVQERAMEMGLVPGTRVAVVRTGRRHLVVALRGFMLSLGRQEARKIEVVEPTANR